MKTVLSRLTMNMTLKQHRTVSAKPFLSFLLIGFFGLLSAGVWGQVNYVSWNFTTNITNANYATNTTNQNSVRTSAISTNAALSSITLTGANGVNANTFHRTTGWPTSQNSSNYLEFSITTNTGYFFPNDAASLNIVSHVSSTTTAARNYQVQYRWGSTGGYSNAGSATTNVGTGDNNSTKAIAAPGNTTATLLTVRILVYGSTSGSGNFRVNTMSLEGESLVTSTAEPSITISDNGTQVAAGFVSPGVATNLVQNIRVDVEDADATLESAEILISGDFEYSDIENVRLWYSATDNFFSATDITVSLMTEQLEGPTILVTIDGLDQDIEEDDEGYFWVTVGIASAAVHGSTFSTYASLLFEDGDVESTLNSGGVQTIHPFPLLAIADNETALVSGDVIQGATDFPVFTFKVAAEDADVELTSAQFLTGGNYAASDIDAYKLWYTTGQTFTGATLLSTNALGVGWEEELLFTGFSLNIPVDQSRYLWITIDLDINAVVNDFRYISFPPIIFDENPPELFPGLHDYPIPGVGWHADDFVNSGESFYFVDGTLPIFEIENIQNTNFWSVCLNETSETVGTFDFYGFNLEGNVTIGPLSGYTFSIDGTNYSTSLTLIPEDGEVANEISILFTPTLNQSYNGNIPISGGGATPTSVAVSGEAFLGEIGMVLLEATSITTSGAISGSSGVSTDCGTITAKGVVWGTADEPTIPSVNSTNDGTGTDGFTSTISGLTANTLYYYRAYATNSVGVTDHGLVLTFTTVSLPATSPTANTATSVGFTAAWDAPTGQGSAPLTYTVQVFSDAGLTTQVGSDITGITGTSTVINTLSPSTTYYYRVAAVNSVGTQFSTWANYTTGITTLDGPCIDEDFETTPPADWIMNSIIYGGQGCTAANASSGSGMVFNASGDYAITPVVTNPQSLSFSKRRSSNTTAWGMTVEISTNAGFTTWATVATLTIADITTTCQTQTIDLSAYTGVRKIRFIDTRASGTHERTIDNVVVMCGAATPEPEISVIGNSLVISNGDSSPSLTDHTEFGNVDVTGGTVVRTFKIKNIGTAALNLTDIPDLVALTGSSDFNVSALPSTPIAAGDSTTFSITLNPSSTGLKEATVAIANDDVNFTFSIQGTGVNNTNSDIIANAGFAYNSNIDYTAYQASTISNTSHSIGAFGFTIRDGGLAAADTDGLGTELTAITFNVSNIANIRSAALFDVNTMVNNTPSINVGGGTITFSGLSGSAFTAANNSTKNLTLRVSFLTTVTDNQQLTYTVASATAASTGSSFASANAGAATSSTTGDRNRIEVTADRIGFVQQPNNTGVNNVISPAVTVEGKDVNNNRDLDYTGSISVTSTGTLTGSPVASNAVSGVASFSGLVHTAVGTGLSLTANTTGLAFSNTATSGTFDITEITFAPGAYRTKNNGTWSSAPANNTADMWQQYDGTNWNDITYPSTSNSTNPIHIYNNVTLNGTNTAYTIIVEEGGVFNTSTVSQTVDYLLVKSGGVYNKQANGMKMRVNTSILEVEDGGTFNFYHTNTTSRTNNVWLGEERFHPNSNFVIKTLDNTSNFLAIQTNDDVNEFMGACFGNFIVDMTAGLMQMLPTGFDKVFAHNLIFRSTSGGNTRLSEGNYSFSVLEDVVIESTYGNNALTVLTTAGTATINIGGDFIHNGTAAFRLANNNTAIVNVTVNIDGNIELTGNGANIDLNGNTNASNASVAVLNVKGDVAVGTNSFITSTHTTQLGAFNFNGTGDGLTAATTQTVSMGSTQALRNQNTITAIKSGAYVQLAQSNWDLGVRSTITVENGASFDFNFNGSTALNVGTVSGASSTQFISQQNAYLKISSPNGLNNTSGTVGNAQTTIAPNINQTARFHFVGKQNQSTGSAIIAADVSGSTAKIVIVELDNNNLVLTGTGTGVIAISAGVTLEPTGGRMEIRRGIFQETPSVQVDGGGRMVMTDGTFRSSVLSTELPQLGNYANYSLTGGTVELNGNGDQILSDDPNGGYFNVAVTNNGIKTVTGSFQIANNLLISAGTFDVANSAVNGTAGLTMTGGRFRLSRKSASLPELTGTATPYALSGGIVELYGTSSAQTHSLRGNYGSSLSINYFNVELNSDGANVSVGAANVVASAGFAVQGTMTVFAPTTFQLASNLTISGTGTFTLDPGSTLKYGGTIAASGATGNIQTAVRNFPTTASYGFVGNANPQVAGTGLPATVANLYLDKNAFNNEVQIGNNITVNGTLQFYNGIVNVGGNTVIIPAAGSVVGAGDATGWVNGNLQKNVAVAANNRSFEIGTSAYTPVSIDYANVTVAGNMTVGVATPDHPQLAAATALNANRSVNRYWTIAQTGITLGSYSPTFNFVAADRDAGVNTSILNVGLYNASWSYPVVGARTATSTQALNITSYGAFALAQNNVSPPINDNPATNSPTLNSNNYVYPNCFNIQGTTSGATVNAATGSADVWYQFNAFSTGVSIRVTSSEFNPVIYLADNSFTVFETESASTGNLEVLNYGNLTIGNTYYIAVASADANQGAFTICVQQLRIPNCGTTAPYSLCTSFKSTNTGSSSVTYSFTNNAVTTSTTAAGPFSLSLPALQLLYGTSYSVGLVANYNLTNAAGDIETIQTSNPNACSITLVNQPSIDVRSNQRCINGATLLRSQYLQAEPVGVGLVCGITGYRVEFTRTTACNDLVGDPLTTFEKVLTTSAASIQLSNAFSAFPLANNPSIGHWIVRWRPVFHGNILGEWGNPRVISVNGTAPAFDMTPQETDEAMNGVETLNSVSANLYPNPNNGDLVNLNMTGIATQDVFVRIMDSMGKVVYTNRYTVDGSLNTIVNFSQPLSAGLYMVEFTSGSEVVTQRMMVAK